MNLKIKVLLFVTLSLLTAVYGQDGTFRCKLIGEVIDRPNSKELLLVREDDDLRISSVSIPIIDGKFEYTLIANHVESYTLNFKDEVENGAWRPLVFFAEQDTLHITLYPQNKALRNRIQGGEVNAELMRYQDQAEVLFGIRSLDEEEERLQEEGKYLTEEAQALRDEIQKAGTDEVQDSLVQLARQLRAEGKDLTPAARENRALFQQQFLAWIEWKTDQVVTNPSLVTFRDLLSLLRMADVPYEQPLPIAVGDLLGSFERHYRARYPEHPYTQQAEFFLTALNTIKKGGKYIDFSAPDFEGRTVTLSKHIQGKYALINFWASWCGPCRRKGKEMIPIYEAFKDRGFEVIGVARERNREAGIDAAKTDQYPWLNLLEVNDNQNIWKKYGLGNSGGGLFLVDNSGVILAVSPSADEVRAILKERLD